MQGSAIAVIVPWFSMTVGATPPDESQRLHCDVTDGSSQVWLFYPYYYLWFSIPPTWSVDGRRDTYRVIYSAHCSVLECRCVRIDIAYLYHSVGVHTLLLWIRLLRPLNSERHPYRIEEVCLGMCHPLWLSLQFLRQLGHGSNLVFLHQFFSYLWLKKLNCLDDWTDVITFD